MATYSITKQSALSGLKKAGKVVAYHAGTLVLTVLAAYAARINFDPTNVDLASHSGLAVAIGYVAINSAIAGLKGSISKLGVDGSASVSDAIIDAIDTAVTSRVIVDPAPAASAASAETAATSVTASESYDSVDEG